VTGFSVFCEKGRLFRRILAGASALLSLLPLAGTAHANSAAVEYFRTRADRSAVPKLLTEDERTWYRDMFASIKRSDWTHVQALFAQKADGPLHSVARAEYYLAAGSPKVDLDSLSQWLTSGSTLPEAEQIGALALRRGATTLPTLPQTQYLVPLRASPRRSLPRDVNDGTMPGNVAAAIQERIKADDPAGARLLLDGVDAALSPEARSQWRQRVAWGYYIENMDGDAYSLGVSAGQGVVQGIAQGGAWAAEGWWTAGLAALRSGSCAEAGDAFANAAATAQNPELAAAAYYWRSRAMVRCRQPERAAAPLRTAAGYDETLYGMLAAEQLGMKLPTTHDQPDFTATDWQKLREVDNVRAAVELAEIGEDGLADEVLRHQARIGAPTSYQQLSRLARDLGLPAAQLWMATNVPAGGSVAPAARYPTPKWTPVNGWQVDPALVYAHTLQESVFRARAVSPAGARGLMQIMPAAARDHAAEIGVAGTAADLTNPEVNLAFGQLHLQSLRNAPATQGLLPKVIAAYNAGPLPVSRWNVQIRDQGDPLLWMESVPYWETRGYVATVLRNYWMYERQAGGVSDSRMALAQGMWPTFPGLSGGKAVRLAANGAYSPQGVIRGN